MMEDPDPTTATTEVRSRSTEHDVARPAPISVGGLCVSAVTMTIPRSSSSSDMSLCRGGLINVVPNGNDIITAAPTKRGEDKGDLGRGCYNYRLRFPCLLTTIHAVIHLSMCSSTPDSSQSIPWLETSLAPTRCAAPSNSVSSERCICDPILRFFIKCKSCRCFVKHHRYILPRP